MVRVWLIVIRPLHNALIEDLLDKVELQVSRLERPKRWGIWVKLLRRIRGMHTSKKPFVIKPDKVH